MSQNQGNMQKIPKRGNRRQTLKGKVVLLIGYDATFLQTLVDRLAQEGADVALICQQHLPLKTVRQIRERVEALGRRFLFLFLAEASSATYSPGWLIEVVLANLGHLDVFIYLPDLKGAEANAPESSEAETFSKWELTRAALEAISTPSF